MIVSVQIRRIGRNMNLSFNRKYINTLQSLKIQSHEFAEST